MTYCNFSEDSDVSVFRDAKVPQAIWCDWCSLVGPIGSIALSEQEMIDHLLEHRKAGHKVPESAIQKLKEEVTK